MNVRCAIIGSGNIGTDLLIKIMRTARYLDVVAMAVGLVGLHVLVELVDQAEHIRVVLLE